MVRQISNEVWSILVYGKFVMRSLCFIRWSLLRRPWTSPPRWPCRVAGSRV